MNIQNKNHVRNLSMLKIKFISGKGRGTIATQPIEKGGLIESAPVCTFPPEQRKIIDRTALFEYYFVKRSEYNSTKNCVSGHIVLGLSTFCNHSENPNAEIKWVENDTGLWADLIALKDIYTHEEVTIFYTNIDKYSSVDNFI